MHAFAALAAETAPSSARTIAEGRTRIALLVDFAPVILGALVGVAQQIIGVRDLGKPRRGLGIILVPVRMEFLGQLAISFLDIRSEEHTSELQSLMRISYAVFCLKKKSTIKKETNTQARESDVMLEK